MPDAEIRVEGLRELRAAMRRAGGTELAKKLRDANLAVAERVAADARHKAPSRSGRLKGSIKAMASQRDARVKGGKASVPYFGWIDFGGVIRPRGHPQRRPFIKKGRILYVAIAQNHAYIMNTYEDSVMDLLRREGFI